MINIFHIKGWTQLYSNFTYFLLIEHKLIQIQYKLVQSHCRYKKNSSFFMISEILL